MANKIEMQLTENTTNPFPDYNYDKLFNHPDLLDCRNISLLLLCPTQFVDRHGYDQYHLCTQYIGELGIYDYDGFKSVQKIKHVIYGWCITVICLLGIVGNILSFIIMQSTDFKGSTTTIYLKALMVIDSFYLSANLIYYGLLLGMKVGKWTITMFPAITRIYVAFNIIDIFRTCSVLFTVAVTVESFLASKLCTQKTSKLAILAMTLIAMIYQIPRFFILKVDVKDGEAGCGTMYLIASSERITEKAEEAIGYTGLVLFILVPLAILTILTVLLIREIKKSKMFRESMRVRSITSRQSSKGEKRGRKHENTTIVLVSVVVTYLVCNLPNTTVLLLRFTKLGQNWVKTFEGSIFYIISILFLNINSAINVLLFCFFGSKFRRVFVRVFLKCQWGKSRTRYQSISQTAYSHYVHSRPSIQRADAKPTQSADADIKL